MNAKFSVKRSYDAIRGQTWSDVVPSMLHNTRKHFANARKSVANSAQRLSLRDGLSEQGLDLVLQNCNVGELLYSCVDYEIIPIMSSKPVVDDVEPGHVSTLELNFQKDIVRLVGQFLCLILPYLPLLDLTLPYRTMPFRKSVREEESNKARE